MNKLSKNMLFVIFLSTLGCHVFYAMEADNTIDDICKQHGSSILTIFKTWNAKNTHDVSIQVTDYLNQNQIPQAMHVPIFKQLVHSYFPLTHDGSTIESYLKNQHTRTKYHLDHIFGDAAFDAYLSNLAGTTSAQEALHKLDLIKENLEKDKSEYTFDHYKKKLDTLAKDLEYRKELLKESLIVEDFLEVQSTESFDNEFELIT